MSSPYTTAKIAQRLQSCPSICKLCYSKALQAWMLMQLEDVIHHILSCCQPTLSTCIATTNSMLHECCRSWWTWSSRADSHDRAALRSLEQRLSIEEIAHFRAFVAARSSTLLAASDIHMQHAVDAVDAVVANLGILIADCICGCVQNPETLCLVKMFICLYKSPDSQVTTLPFSVLILPFTPCVPHGQPASQLCHISCCHAYQSMGGVLL